MLLHQTFRHPLLKQIYSRYTTPAPNLRNILITAALPYVNNTPHLGNIIGGVLSADVYARYCRMMKYNTFFVCGTDEYGTTTEVKALAEKVSEQEICDKYHRIHADIYKWFSISFDHFGRTTNPIHSEISQQILSQIHKNGALTQKQSQQFFCDSCSMNLADRYVKGTCSNCGSPAKGDQCDGCSKVFKDPILELKDPKCSICKTSPRVIKTRHLYLKLSEMNEHLQNWITAQNQDSIKLWSKNAQGVTKGWLKNKLEDRCITRDLKWGVQVPSKFIEGKVMYVWFQAPLGYISMTAMKNPQWQKWWIPEQETKVQLNQFMGKDNIMFHSIMAPSTLMSTGKPWVKPHRIAATEYLMFEGGKFSKSNNFGVFGNDCQNIGINSDVWRYCLLSNRPETFDSEFTWEYFVTRNNKDLVNTIGNMCQRILKYIKLKFKGRCPNFYAQSMNDPRISSLDAKFIEDMYHEMVEYLECLQRVELKHGSQKLLEMSAIFNKYLQDTEFWDKKHIPTKRNQTIIGLAINILNLYAVLLDPFLPSTSQRLLEMLKRPVLINFSKKTDLQSLKVLFIEQVLGQNRVNEQETMIGQPQILFHQISEQRMRALEGQYGTSKKQ